MLQDRFLTATTEQYIRARIVPVYIPQMRKQIGLRYIVMKVDVVKT
ncbi:MAG: hypothetical protein ACI4F4_01170 [Lachnospiraceae bacterium]